MVVKKKLTKQATTKRAPKGKSNRGRPRKEFKPKHKRMQEMTPVSTGIVEHRIPKYEKIFRMPSKDKSIFYLFVFSIVLFLCSLTISFFKKHDIQQLENSTENAAITGEITTQTTEQTAGGVTQTVENMYGVINAKSFDELSNYRDSSLKNSNTVRTYFNTKRLTRFLGGIQDGTVAIRNIQQEPIKDYSWKVTYNLSYTLLDGTTFDEQRNVTVIKKDDAYTIASLKCETTGCSRMPFFNPGKFDIK